MDKNNINSELMEFRKRAIALVGNKFIQVYSNTKEEIEHFYESWSQLNIREIELRNQVWRHIMQTLICKKNK